MNNKKAQFYIVAALIIIGIIIVFISTTTYVQHIREKDRIYDVGDILEFETASVIDYGVYNKQDLQELFENWTETIIDYKKQEEEIWFFIYLDEQNINNSGIFAPEEVESSSVDLGGTSISEKEYEIRLGNGFLKIGNLEFSIEEGIGENKAIVFVKQNEEIIYEKTITYDSGKQNVWFLIKTETASVSPKD
jgi:hypothetical protein